MLRTLTSLGILLVAVAVVMMYIKPRYDETKNLETTITQLELAEENSRNLSEEWGRLIDQYDAVPEDDRERVLAMIPDDTDNVKLILEIDALAASLGLSLLDIDVDDSVVFQSDSEIAAAEYGTLGLKMTVVGEYLAFIEFAEKLESSLRLIDIKEISFSPERDDDEPDNSVYEYELVVHTYWLR